MIIADALLFNELMGKATFKDLSFESFATLMDLKLQLSKINEDKDNFIKSSLEELKKNKLDNLEENSDEYKKEYDLILKNLNSIVLNYVIKDVEIKEIKISKEELYKFCNNNEFNGSIIEFLYKQLL